MKRDFFDGRKVLITGHTGFKGGWLTLILNKLGAEVTGLSLAPDQGPDNIFDRASIESACHSVIGDIRDRALVDRVFAETQPSLVFHLAAQPLVRRSYADPIGTFASNVMGTAHVLEASRTCGSVEAVVCVTTDKVYENREWNWPYRENEPLGGIDPYSASKSAAEMVARAYMTTLNSACECRIATARGGNVVGGGDWSEDRIVPDIVRAVRAGASLVLRHPGATRPWQHVLEACDGYMLLAQRLIEGRSSRGKTGADFIGAWNFGPDAALETPVSELAQRMLEAMARDDHPVELGDSTVHESSYLRLDSTKAVVELGWRQKLDFAATMSATAEWYRDYLADPARARDLIERQIDHYLELESC
ncbi:MAG: CDP-glucose 4,6-dehydratase [Betaproteobacteria bacterium]|nr:CDP-glucose 4,6-dehydratase [Betaproteobacteria bacterium]